MRGAIHQKSRGVEFRDHVSKLFLDQLMFSQEPPKLPASQRVTQCFVKRASSHAARGGPNAGAKGIERIHCQTESIALVSHHIFSGYATIVEGNFAYGMWGHQQSAFDNTKALHFCADNKRRE